MDLLIQADKENDAFYVGFGAGAFHAASVDRSIRVTDDITLDFNESGQLVGLDIMNAASVLAQDPSTLTLDSLLGVKEAAELAGIQKSNFVRDYASDPDFPAPVCELANGRIWLRSQVMEYLTHRSSSRSSGRKRTASPDFAAY